MRDLLLLDDRLQFLSLSLATAVRANLQSRQRTRVRHNVNNNVARLA
jgi:hypothetical protein